MPLQSYTPDRIMSKLMLNTIFKYPKAILATSFFITTICSLGLLNFKLSNDFKVYFDKNLENVKYLDFIESKYTKEENIFVIINNKSEVINSKEDINYIRLLTEKFWQTPNSLRVDSITNHQHSFSKNDDIFIENLVEDKNVNLLTLNKILTKNKDLTNFFISENKHITAIQITLALSDNLSERRKQIPDSVNFVRNLINKEAESKKSKSFYISGSVLMNQVMGELSMKDTFTIIPISYLIIFVLLLFFLRSLYMTIVILSIVSMVNGILVGLTGWAKLILAPVAGFIPCTILIIGIADSIHIIATFYQEYTNKDNLRSAIEKSIRYNLKPVVLTTVTTIVGFLCLNFSDSPPYRELGNMVAIGAFFAMLATLILLPAFLFAFPPKPKSLAISDKIFEPLAKSLIDKKNIYLVFFSLIILIMGYFLSTNKLDDVWNNYFSEKTNFRQASDFTNKNLTGIHRVYFDLENTSPQGIYDINYLNFLENLRYWLEKKEEVSFVDSIDLTFKKLNKNMHGDAESYYKIPDSNELAAQYLLLYELSLPYGLGLENRISQDKKSSRLTILLHKMSSQDLLKLSSEIESWINNNKPASVKDTKATGIDIVFGEIADNNSKSMMIGTIIAFLIISLIIAAFFKSFKFGAISLIPNFIPSVIAFGVWGILVSKIGLATSVVVAMAIGIIVDDTIHFMSKYYHARKDLKLSSEQSLIYSYKTSGLAITITSIVLFFGFIILGISTFQPTAYMGLLMAITIMSALICDLIFLPAILLTFDKKVKSCKKMIT